MGRALAKRRHVAMSDDRELVFVYGTLRKGASNQWRMAEAEFVGKVWVRGRLFRVDWYPGLVLDPKGAPILGELYRVTLQQVAALDDFEGITGAESDEFERVRVTVQRRGSREPQRAWLWEFRRPSARFETVPRNDWLECELPRRPPLFLGIALLPAVVLLLCGLFPEAVDLFPNMMTKVFPWLMGCTPIMMAIAAEASLRRREHGDKLAAIALFIGAVGTLLAVVWILYEVFG